MNILVLSGNPEPSNTFFDGYLHSYQMGLHKMGQYVKTYHLRNLKIAGIEHAEQIITRKDSHIPSDDVRYIKNMLDETDLLVFADPLKQGSLSILTKFVQYRIGLTIQNDLYRKKFNQSGVFQEQHIPLLGVIVQRSTDTTQQEFLLNKLAQERNAANLNTVLSFFVTTETGPAEAVSETFRSASYQLSIEDTYQVS